MTITREQIADLQPGDVVELRRTNYHGDVLVRGPLFHFAHSVGEMKSQGLAISDTLVLRRSDGEVSGQFRGDWFLTVVSRAPRPLYVNHPRTEPVPGDVVRDADGGNARTWFRPDDGGLLWRRTDGSSGESGYARHQLPARLRLLVDGETGQVVQ